MRKIVFGTGGLKGREGECIIREALDVGFNIFDTAAAYENEETVGRAIKCYQEDVKIITKVRGADHGFVNTIKAVENSLRLLKRDFVDYYLIHWPLPQKNQYLSTFEALLEMKNKGYIKQVGVSNFNIRHLQEVYNQFGIYPEINQIELHPYFQQNDIREFHEVNRIETFAWSSLNKAQRGILEDPIICEIAQENKLSPAQVILAFEQEINVVPIVKSKNKLHMLENYASQRITLKSEYVETLKGLDRGWRRGGDPEIHDEQ